MAKLQFFICLLQLLPESVISTVFFAADFVTT